MRLEWQRILIEGGCRGTKSGIRVSPRGRICIRNGYCEGGDISVPDTAVTSRQERTRVRNQHKSEPVDVGERCPIVTASTRASATRCWRGERTEKGGDRQKKHGAHLQ